MKSLPWATVIAKGTALHRHPISLNILLPLVRTRWWLQWEDDWMLPRGGASLLNQAIDVAQSSGVHQLAVNGAWLEHDSAWGVVDRRSHVSSGSTLMGASWVEILYPAADRARLAAGRETMEHLGIAYSNGVTSRQRGAAMAPVSESASLLWPLYSNQPSLNDTAFMQALLPFREERAYNAPGMCTQAA